MDSSLRADTLVSIGVPTFNAATSVLATLKGLTQQTHEKLQITVADNASTDGTADIAEDVAKDDPRITVIHHSKNLGAQANFRFLLTIAKGPLFMWAGSDDVHHQAFVAANLERIISDNSLSGSVSHVRWMHRGVPGALAAGTGPLVGTPRQNLARYMRSARDNSRFYGLFRKDALLPSFPDRDIYGFDIWVMAGTFRFGGHARVDGVLLERERRHPSQYIKLVEADENGLLDRLLPLRQLTGLVLTQDRELLSFGTLWWLGWRNVYEHVRYWATTGGTYGRLARSLQALLESARRKAWRIDDSDTP